MATVTLTFKTTDAQARQLRKAAKAQKTTLSEYLRRAAEANLNKPAKAAKGAKWTPPDTTARSLKILGPRVDTFDARDFIG
jgi:hypothetical protein